MFQWIIVGAGFTGATLAERIATQKGEKVLVVERRGHIAGNAYDHRNAAGVLVHKYGPHIFHTNSKKVWDYLQPFSDWRPYFHRVLASIDGIEAPIPFNLNTMDAVFPRAMAERYGSKLIERFGYGARVPILQLMKEEDEELKFLANFVYEKVFKSYTFKQWELLPDELSPSVTARVPILVSRDDRYFQDAYQAMPAQGYTALFERMLDHDNIHLMLRTDFREVRQLFPGARVIYTGPIDEYFDYCYGPLPYRSLAFRHETVDRAQCQKVGTVNYPNEHDFTRITEMRHLTGEDLPRSTLIYEYPRAHEVGVNDPYYPIPRDETRVHHERYLKLARERGDVLFCGRLGDYRYYNMDQAVAAALALFEKGIMNSAG